jgi:hypothetical protein
VSYQVDWEIQASTRESNLGYIYVLVEQLATVTTESGWRPAADT